MIGFQRFVGGLPSAAAIILAVVSKNEGEKANALLPFREHPNMVLREADISVFVANWNNKARGNLYIRLVQQVLNIGFESLVFLDDNAFERGLVRQVLPSMSWCPTVR